MHKTENYPGITQNWQKRIQGLLSRKEVIYSMYMELQHAYPVIVKQVPGEFLMAYPKSDTLFASTSFSPVMQLTLYKGQFSNDGKFFNGTVYRRDVYYDLEYKKDEPRLVSKIKVDLRDEAFWKPGEMASGTMKS